MARIVRDAALVSRSARLRLAPSSKRWRMLEQGLHLGYRRRATVGTLFKNAYQNMRGWETHCWRRFLKSIDLRSGAPEASSLEVLHYVVTTKDVVETTSGFRSETDFCPDGAWVRWPER
jgi:hypothetical protein